MRMSRVSIIVLLTISLAITVQTTEAQRYISDFDSTIFLSDTVRTLVRRFENLHFSGYIQPQFQVAEVKGASSYSGGDFLAFADNRFMLRRARIKIDYRLAGKVGQFPAAVFSFQVDATERDVNVRDMFIRVFEPSKNNFSLTAGLFGRPFGFEVNLSSAFRETPERGRMSQILMPSERDLGAMLTYESQRTARKKLLIKFDLGVFNGQGKSGPAEFDSYKDLISRLTLKPFTLTKKIKLSGGLSLLRGGWVQATKYKYQMGEVNGTKLFIVDSAITNIGNKAPRQYYGADAQFIITNRWGKTEIRAEYWRGKQPGIIATTFNPGVLPTLPTYIRNFDGAFFYFLQNIINKNWELMAKYDWYDSNTNVGGTDIGKAGSNLTLTDIKFSTLGFGLTRYFNDNLKLLAYYDWVKNESTTLTGYAADALDNVLTVRMQFRF